jgi:hypothetical protein
VLKEQWDRQELKVILDLKVLKVRQGIQDRQVLKEI